MKVEYLLNRSIKLYRKWLTPYTEMNVGNKERENQGVEIGALIN